MKRLIFLALCVCAVIGPCAACGAENSGLRVVTTIFPEYDWVREILGDVKADVTLLLDDGVDLHSYQPTVDDMVKVAACDLFIHVGGESDAWVKDALKNAVNRKQVALNLLEVLGDSVKTEELVEGMEHDHDHDDDDDDHDHGEHGHHHGESVEPEADEHVWLSLGNAEKLCRAIARTLASLDPEHAATYAANVERYIEKLSALDKQYRAAVDGAARKVLLFGDRFPFRYLVDDYGLKYYAAFSGCSAETEASFETVMFLANKAEELKLPCIMTIEGTRHKIAETIAANTASKNQCVLTMDSMQSTTLKDAQGGAAYLSIMERNLETLKDALN